jgi:hypothetical protein
VRTTGREEIEAQKLIIGERILSDEVQDARKSYRLDYGNPM